MADFAREMEEFKAANRTFGGEWKVEMKSNFDQPSAYRSTTTTTTTPKPPPPQPTIHLWTAAPSYNKAAINNHSYKNYGYNPRVTWSSSNSEMKMKRRVLKYKSYAAESQLKSSLTDGFRWMKTKYCQFVRGY